MSAIAKAAAAFRDGFTCDPGHSDLDNEQPIHVRATLGDWRALNMALAEDRWIPVTERLPDDDLTVMIAPLESDEDVWLGYHDADGWHFVDAMPAHVSHWKPMPEGPKP